MPNHRTVFYLSDGTGITAETLGRSLISQFDSYSFEHNTIPYIQTIEDARRTVIQINAVAEREKKRPLIIATLVNPEVREVIATSDALYLDVFAAFIRPLEQELTAHSSHRVGRLRGIDDYTQYQTRIEAIDFTIATDDGARGHRYSDADLILVGVSRCGKTPTSLYLALQHGLRVSNYPITEEDVARGTLPEEILSQRHKLFGLTIDAQRLHAIRAERRPGSRYAELIECQRELRFAENMFMENNINYLNTTSLSIEEIATKIIAHSKIEKRLAR